MRLLHTADWHVGRAIRGHSRADEHRAVLAEIAELADEHAVDVVLVAGDQFDTAAPSAEAEQIVYAALLDLARTGRRLGAREALDLGLVSQVVPHGEVSARVAALVERILSYDAEAVRRVSEVVTAPVVAALARCAPGDVDRAGDLLGEIGLLTWLAIPLGCAAGTGYAALRKLEETFA